MVRAHAYTVLKAQPVESNGRGQVLLVQVRAQRGATPLLLTFDVAYLRHRGRHARACDCNCIRSMKTVTHATRRPHPRTPSR